MKKIVLIMIAVLMVFCLGCATTQNASPNELAGTTWVVRDGQYSGTSLLFNSDGSANMTMRNILDTGTYVRRDDGFYFFQFEDGTGSGGRTRNETFELNGAQFILKSGDASGNWAGTVWWTDFSTEDRGTVLSCYEDETFTVVMVLKYQGTYILQNTKVSINFPQLNSDGNINGNNITFGSLKFEKQ